ncbi:UbiA prenyltransferase family protein [Halobellus captivus]|uniref:UbiA family prenyltransferase n=1 Tax=Halobellus captivus TaxID=2592614 RepID=UPI0011A52C15|nr:UbiA family prenyltransferase [Halobellus captivus]
MTRARRGLEGLLAHVRPTFMLPAVGMSAYGAALAPNIAFEWSIAALHAATVGLALYVAHLRDGYVDGHLRGEEEPRLGVSTFRWGVGAGSAGVLLLSGILAATAGPIPALSTIALLSLALLHAPYLDRHPVTVTVDYPLGIALTLVGGYATQSDVIDPLVVLVALLFAGLLSGIKIGIDRLDESFDESIGKRTIPVALSASGADRVALGVFSFTAVAVVGLGLGGLLGVVSARPLFAFAAASAPVTCALATMRLDDESLVRVQMTSTYVFAVALFFAACDGGCTGFVLVERVIETVVR